MASDDILAEFYVWLLSLRFATGSLLRCWLSDFRIAIFTLIRGSRRLPFADSVFFSPVDAGLSKDLIFPPATVESAALVQQVQCRNHQLYGPPSDS